MDHGHGMNNDAAKKSDTYMILYSLSNLIYVSWSGKVVISNYVFRRTSPIRFLFWQEDRNSGIQSRTLPVFVRKLVFKIQLYFCSAPLKTAGSI